MFTCRLRSVRLLLMVCLSGLTASAQDVEQWADQIVKSVQRSQPLPTIGAQSGRATEGVAYQVQHAVVKKLVDAGDEVVGHKAGLTSGPAQAQFGLYEPVAGELLKSQLKTTASFISLRQFKHTVVELELGFELKLTIRQEPRSVEELKTYVRSVVPIVELPNPYFPPGERVSGLDVIATNVAAANVVVGHGKPYEEFDLAALTVRLERNDEVVAEGQGSDTMGDPWEALLWLVRQRLREGFEVRRNDLLITGSLGPVVPGTAGRYVADFGKLGRVTFSMR